jgi:hypothetical protein
MKRQLPANSKNRKENPNVLSKMRNGKSGRNNYLPQLQLRFNRRWSDLAFRRACSSRENQRAGRSITGFRAAKFLHVLSDRAAGGNIWDNLSDYDCQKSQSA